MLVRKANLKDSTAILDLLDQYDRAPYDRPKVVEVQKIFTIFKGRTDGIYVAVKDKEIVGTFSLYICPNLNQSGKPFAVLENVIIKSNHRRQGIGKFMMQEAIIISKAANCYKIMLQSSIKRQENHTFYESCGFSADKIGFQMRLH